MGNSLFTEKLEKLQKLRETASDEEKKKIDNTIDTIYDLLELERYESSPIDWKRAYIYEEAELNYAKKFFSLMIPIILSDYNPSKVYRLKLNISDDALFNIIGEFFYRDLDKELFSVAMSMYEKRKDTIHITHESDASIRGASMIYLPYFNEVHMFLNRYNTITDFTRLNHEFGHGTEVLYTGNEDIMDNASLFEEITSTFFEFISLDYLKSIRRFRSLGIAGENNSYLNTIADGKKMLMESQLFDKWRKLKQMDFDARKPYFEKDIRGVNNIFNLDSDKINIDGLLEERFSDISKYLIGTNIAIELFMLYYHDRDKGLEMLKRCMKLDWKLDDECLRDRILSLGIDPSSHISEFEEYLDSPRMFALKK